MAEGYFLVPVASSLRMAEAVLAGVCSSIEEIPQTIIEVTSPWMRQATAFGPNNPPGRRVTGA